MKRTKKEQEHWEESSNLMNNVKKDRIKFVKETIDSGFDVNTTFLGLSALDWAASNGNLKIVKYLVSKKANVNIRAKGIDNRTPLHSAVRSGHFATVNCLLNNGADVNAVDSRNWTPLHLAVQRREKTIAKNLLKHGAELNIKNSSDETPLEMAIRMGKKDMVNILKKIEPPKKPLAVRFSELQQKLKSEQTENEKLKQNLTKWSKIERIISKEKEQLQRALRAEKIENEKLKQKNYELECRIATLHSADNVSEFVETDNNTTVKQEFIKTEVKTESGTDM